MVPEPEKQKPAPGSFDSLVAGMDGQFRAIEDEVEKMQDKLKKADEESAALEKRLVDGASGRPRQHS